MWFDVFKSSKIRYLYFRILEKLMVLLRDGKTLIGILRSIDQFGKFNWLPFLKSSLLNFNLTCVFNWSTNAANLVLHKTIERIYVGDKYGDIERGIFIVRGENVALCGEIVRIIYKWLKTNLLILWFLF